MTEQDFVELLDLLYMFKNEGYPRERIVEHGVNIYPAIDTVTNAVDFELGKMCKKKPWKPKIGEEFYVANAEFEGFFSIYTWEGCEDDERMYRRGIVFKTKVEAIALGEKMAELARRLQGLDIQ